MADSAAHPVSGWKDGERKRLRFTPTAGEKMKQVIGILFFVIVGLALAPGAAGQTPAVVAGRLGEKAVQGKGFTFVVMGDNRTPWGRSATVKSPEVSPVFVELIEQVNLTSPDLVLITGDLIGGHTEPEAVIREWDAFDEAIERFNAPCYMVVGNHDIWNNWSRELYVKRYGPEWYSFNHKGAHFIVLSTEVAGQAPRIAGDQLAWLKKDLAEHSGYKPTYVFGHQPLWGYGGTMADWVGRTRQDAMYDSWMRDVHPVLKKYGVDTVFGGHWHQYIFEEIDGIRYVVTGGGGAEIGGAEAPEWRGRFYHYVIATVRDGQTRIAVAKRGGVAPDDVVTLDTWRTTRKLLDDLVPTRIKIARGDNRLPRQVTCTAINPFDEPLSGQLVLATPVGSPWTLTPQSVPIFLPAGRTLRSTFQIAYTGPAGEEDAAKWQGMCAASIRVGKRVLWHDTSFPLQVDRWPYADSRALLEKNLAPPAVSFQPRLARRIVMPQENPIGQPVKLSFVWTVPPGGRWTVTPARHEVTLGAGQKAEVAFDVAFEGSLDEAPPLPSLTAVARAGDEVVARHTGPLAVGVQSFVRAHPRRASCARVSAPPNIDGRLTDAAWKSLDVHKGFIRPTGSALVADQTEFRVGYDDTHLYLGIRFHGSGAPKAKVTAVDDDDIWVDDAVEIFLDANLDRKTYHHIIINANGAYYDARMADKTWDSHLTAAVGTDKESWTIETAIPWNHVTGAVPAGAARMGLNLVRDWPTIQQYSHSQWSPTLSGNHVPQRFGNLVFE